MWKGCPNGWFDASDVIGRKHQRWRQSAITSLGGSYIPFNSLLFCLCFVVSKLWTLVYYFSSYTHAQIKCWWWSIVFMILWLCDGNDSRVVDKGQCAWCLEKNKCRTMEKRRISVFLTLTNWIAFVFRIFKIYVFGKNTLARS